MIQPHEITIGSLLRTNKGEVIKVDSISTKRQHRKVGYHRPDDPYHIKYVRLAQCEGIEITPQWLLDNGFSLSATFPYGEHYSMQTDADRSIHGYLSVTLYRLDGEYTGDTKLEYDDCVIDGWAENPMPVHKLQMALHLLGHSQIANQFK